MSSRLLLLTVAVLLALAAGCVRAKSNAADKRREVHVLAASSLREVLVALEPAFERSSGADLVFSFGPSGQLQKQIESGAPADAFLSASSTQIDALVSAGLISAEETLAFASNDLVILVPKGNPAAIDDPEDLLKTTRLVTGNPQTAPHGSKAKEWLTLLGLWETLQPKLIFAENASQTRDYVARAEVDAGIGFRSEAAGSDEVEIAYVVPSEQATPSRYVAATVEGSTNGEVALAFITYLLGEQAQTALLNAGFNPSPSVRER